MHKMFRELLNNATGISEFIVAVYVDIRNFSKFSQKVESPNVAMYIKRVYMKLIDEYFTNACFFKPAGDGLLILIPYSEQNLCDVLTDTINNCFRAMTDFGSFAVKDRMINFDVPQKIGIGLSRGVACRLFSGDKVLDYSGRPLNLASRLNDLARPSGIVFDTSFGIDCLPTKLANRFEIEKVYIKGISEEEPLEIFFSKDYTTIDPRSKKSIQEIEWHVKKDNRTLKEIKDLGSNFNYKLDNKPVDPEKVRIQISHPTIKRGRKLKGFVTFFDFSDFEYYLEAGKPKIRIQFDALAKRLAEEGIKSNWNITIKIMYPK